MNRKLKTFTIAAVAAVASMVLTGVASAGSWQPLNNQPTFVASTAMLLTDGTVMVHEYAGRPWWKLTPDINGSYVNGTWTPLASLASNYSPLYYASAVLPDGRMIIEGGEYNFLSANWTKLGAIYDPLTDIWTPVTAPAGWNNIGDGQNVVLANGQLMQANALTKQQAILNATSLTWTTTGTGKIDINDEEGWVLLPGGLVATTDSNNTANPLQAERYNPNTGAWKNMGSTIVALTDPGSHEIGPQVLRPNGTVVFFGGTKHNAIFTIATRTWAAGPDYPVVGSQLDMADAPASLVPNGNILISTSPGVFKTPVHFFEFDGANFIAQPDVPNNPVKTSYEGRMLLLPTGQVLYTDGSRDVEIYTPTGSANAAWAPTILSVPSLLTHGNSYVISGTQFNGLSQACMYGDDAACATNYPLVRITNGATGHVSYARTHGHSTMGVATGALTTSTMFDVPAGIELGASSLVVVANAIASAPSAVTIQ